MKAFSIEDIRSWDPCYDPKKYLPEDWQGTTIDILNMNKIPFADRLWCVLRTELISERVMRLVAVWAYRDTLNWIKNPDPRSIAAADIAEKFVLGQATEEEKSAAESAAWSAFDAAADSTADFTIGCAAKSAADSTAWFAVESAARAVATCSPQSAAERQRNKLIEMILADERDNL